MTQIAIRLFAQLVIRFGIPYIISGLKKLFPSINVGELGDAAYEMHKEISLSKKTARAKASHRLNKYCDGIGCPPQIKNVD